MPLATQIVAKQIVREIAALLPGAPTTLPTVPIAKMVKPAPQPASRRTPATSAKLITPAPTARATVASTPLSAADQLEELYTAPTTLTALGSTPLSAADQLEELYSDPVALAALHSTPLSKTAASLDLARIDQLESIVMELTKVVKSLTPQPQKSLSATVMDDDMTVPETPSLSKVIADVPAAVYEKGGTGDDASVVGSGALMADEMATGRGTAVATAPESDWILTTHVGSLPRAIIAKNGTVTVPELDAKTIIDQQRAAGLSIINDGEWSRENYIADLLSRLEGVGSDGDAKGGPACLCEMPVAEDMRAVPTYAKRFTGGNGLITLNPMRIAAADQARALARPPTMTSDDLR